MPQNLWKHQQNHHQITHEYCHSNYYITYLIYLFSAWLDQAESSLSFPILLLLRYSTVTLFARFLGLSTSSPLATLT